VGEARRQTRMSGPVEEFRVSDGKLAITVDVQGDAPSTLIFDADKIADLAAAVERLGDKPPYHALVRHLGRSFVARRRNGQDMTDLGGGILWTALYHPQHGSNMRIAVSRALRDMGKAHITWSLSDKGFGLALGATFLDFDNILAVAPKDVSFSFRNTPNAEETAN
jgi:hypothetical protein